MVNENLQFRQKHEILEQPVVSPGPGGLLLPSWLTLQPLRTWVLSWNATFKGKRQWLWDVGLPGRRSICTQTPRASATGMLLGGRLSHDDPEEEVASGRWAGGQREFYRKKHKVWKLEGKFSRKKMMVQRIVNLKTSTVSKLTSATLLQLTQKGGIRLIRRHVVNMTFGILDQLFSRCFN